MFSIYRKFRSWLLTSIIEYAKPFVWRFSKPLKWDINMESMRAYPPESFGYKITQVLDTYNFTLIPHYESHDAKHILLDYEMTAEGEVQLQCFMLGNGHVIFTVAFAVCLGFILMPDQWNVFYRDILRGYRTPSSISTIDFCQLLPCDLKSVQKELLYSTQAI